jgi:hypothetical protein
MSIPVSNSTSSNSALVLSLAALLTSPLAASSEPVAASRGAVPLERVFDAPPASARAWVYWYFMDGNITREGILADLEAMKAAGIGGVLFLEIGANRPARGPVEFLSPQWLDLFGFAVQQADRLGLEVSVGTGPGWCGAGGTAVTPDDAMQHTVASETTVTGPADFSALLPVPPPRRPFFGESTLTPETKEAWRTYYRDEAVIAFREPAHAARVPDAQEKALYWRAPYSSRPGVKPYLAPSGLDVPSAGCVPLADVVDLTKKMDASGRLSWRVPEGRWTILRVGRRLTGQTTRPAPKPGLGFETGKFERGPIERHLKAYADKLLAVSGPRRPGRGLTTLHFDSWEMSAQNGSAGFFDAFTRRRGYSPLPYLPAINGRVVGSVDLTERFLWDWRRTAQELVVENHLQTIKAYAHRNGLAFSSEAYDMNPCCDMTSGAVADVPMCEFWSKGMGFETEYSCLGAVSVAHTTGRPVVGAEAFTAAAEYWRQYPGSMKAQGDWAFCFGINRLTFHTYQHQPSLTDRPGMTMCGYYGVNWHRNQTWWPMVDAYHLYLSRCQAMLREGRPVGDILYLLPEDAPFVFVPPADVYQPGAFKDRRGTPFDGCAPETFLARAVPASGVIDFPGGGVYRALVLPRVASLSPALLKKVLACAEAGVPIFGRVPDKAPGLSGYPASDAEAAALAAKIRAVAKGRLSDRQAEAAACDRLSSAARWIWTAASAGVNSQPPGSRWFRKTLTLPDSAVVSEATAVISADNAYRLFVNGEPVGTGIEFKILGRHDVKGHLKGGDNTIEILADNWDETDNPAGVIAAVAVLLADGRTIAVQTDTTWTGSLLRDEKSCPVREYGALSAAPWRLTATVELYPSYASVVRALAESGSRPDFESDGDLRVIHRRRRDADIYFVGNRRERQQATRCRFRVAGAVSAEWWDPLTGERRRLPDMTSDGSSVELPLTFGPGESGFVVFRPQASALPPEASNVRVYRTLGTVDGAWRVRFDPAWGGPAGEVDFAALTDWTTHAQWGIRHYSGIAAYRKTVSCSRRPEAICLGDVADLARVKLNGTDLGAVWCPPWRVAVPAGVWKEGDNDLVIEVANLWRNRLIGDASLPEDKRLTRTTVNPHRPNSPLRRSGLFGPVTLQTRERQR